MALDMSVVISLKSFSPHKNIFGNDLLSFGHTTTSSANGITGFVMFPLYRPTTYSWVIEIQGEPTLLNE